MKAPLGQDCANESEAEEGDNGSFDVHFFGFSQFIYMIMTLDSFNLDQMTWGKGAKVFVWDYCKNAGIFTWTRANKIKEEEFIWSFFISTHTFFQESKLTTVDLCLLWSMLQKRGETIELYLMRSAHSDELLPQYQSYLPSARASNPVRTERSVDFSLAHPRSSVQRALSWMWMWGTFNH